VPIRSYGMLELGHHVGFHLVVGFVRVVPFPLVGDPKELLRFLAQPRILHGARRSAEALSADVGL
jgi:hypothetical protein